MAALREQELVLSPARGWWARWAPAAVLASIAMLGTAKVFVGVSRGKPVMYLLLLVAATLLVGLLLLGRPAWQTRKGSRILRQVRLDEQRFRRREREVPWNADEAALAFGLFGVASLGPGVSSELRRALAPAERSQSFSDSGCTGTTGNSGCGGGGAGHGCGGGGCGGCSGH